MNAEVEAMVDREVNRRVAEYAEGLDHTIDKSMPNLRESFEAQGFNGRQLDDLMASVAKRLAAYRQDMLVEVRQRWTVEMTRAAERVVAELAAGKPVEATTTAATEALPA